MRPNNSRKKRSKSVGKANIKSTVAVAKRKRVTKRKELKPIGQSVILPNEWLANINDSNQRNFIVKVLLSTFVFTSVAAIMSYYFQGFHFLGFTLDSSLLNGLNIFTIGQMAGLIGVILAYYFKK